MSTSAIALLLVAATSVVVTALGLIYSRLQHSADALSERFDNVDAKLEKVKDDLSKTKSTVAFIRGQLIGTPAQRKARRNGADQEDEE